jgi:hypothetical protein
MAKATWDEWQQNMQWNPSNVAGDPMLSGNRGSRYDRDAYENYSRTYDQYAASGNVGALRGINNAHGFFPGVAGGDVGGHHLGGGGGGGGGGGAEMAAFQSMFTEMMSKYETLLDAFLNQNAESSSQPDGGMGFEDTILSRSVLSEEDDRGRTIPRFGGYRVVDPKTGQTYASPQAAVAAGVNTWKYLET